MPPEARLLTGLALAVATVYWATPVAIRVAHRLSFYDRPVGYKGHAAPTPYLGGAAVVLGFLGATLALTGDLRRTIPLAMGVFILWVVGTVDDRRNVTPLGRVAVEVALAAGLWQLGLGWELGLGAGVDLFVTAAWIVAVVNAFNLFDNMDGAATTMASVASAGLMILGIVEGDTWLSVVAAALCGACLGFLPHNLASPSRIFLGDGGSMPVGFAVAALAMIGVSDANAAWQALAIGLLLVGVPALDTALVVVSRTRRGISVLTGGRDHLTHRARQRLRTARAVALSLGGLQAVISALALVAIRGGSGAVLAAVLLYLIGVGVAIAVLDTRLAPVGPAVATPTPLADVADEAPGAARFASVPRSLPLLLPLAICLGVSPFFAGFYDSRIWVPAGLALVVLVTGGVIAAPLRLSRAGVLALVGLGGLAAWALISTLWAESVEQAVVDGNRLMVLAALLAAILLLVRSDRSALWLVGALIASVVTVGAITLAQMLGTDAASLFVAGRLDGPLGYINGQASFYLLALWPCVALAEQRRWPALSGVGMALASSLGSLLVLSQSRGVAIATLVSAIVVLALVPGRLRRAWVFVVLGGSLAVAIPTLLDVYEQGRAAAVPGDVASSAATAALLSAAVAGVVWGLVTWAGQRSEAVAHKARPVSAGLLALGLAAFLAVGVASSSDISRTVDEQYTAFVRLGVEPQGSASLAAPSSRLASGAGTRYDYWRIAWSTFRDHPVEGIGAGNYDVPYFTQRATTEDVRQPHSLALQSLSELGVIGAALLLLFLAGLALGALQLAKAARLSATARFLAVAGSGAVAAWIAHTSVDWIHLLPGVSGVALALGAVLLVRRPDAPEQRAVIASGAGLRRLRPGLATALIVAISLATAGVSLSRQGLAEHFRVTAQRALAERPADALRDADRSLRLDPAAVETYYVKAAALARFNEGAAARESLLAAARREPHDFVTWALLGDLSVRAGNLSQARRDYRRASELNPRDAGLREAALHPARAAESG